MLETLPDTAETETYIDSFESEVQFVDETRESERESEESTIVVEPAPTSEFRVATADANTRSSFNSIDTSRLDNVWTITFDGGSYRVLFPKTDDLVVVDGALVNIGSSNITGVVVGNSLDLTTYVQRTVTVLPLMGSNAQNTAYNYHAHAYMTYYTQGNYGLNTTQTYGNISVSSRGRLGSTWSSVNVVIIGLLALQVLISFIGGLLKRG